MNLEQLKYTVEVAKSGSLTIASEELHITQSAISQAITGLEKELGVKIFKRSRHGATPTDVGNKIIKKAIEALNKLDELQMEANQSLNLINGNLRIGTIPSPLMYLPKTLSSYKKDYPNVRIQIFEKSSQDIIHDIKQDKLDIGLIGLSKERTEMNDQDIHSQIILQGKMIAAASKHSPLAFADTVTPEEMLKHSLVIYNDDRMWEFINYLFQIHHADILFSTNNLDAIRNAVTENLAITIAPDYTIKNDPHVMSGEITPITIAGPEQDYIGMALIWANINHNPTLIENFVSRLTSDMAERKNHS